MTAHPRRRRLEPLQAVRETRPVVDLRRGDVAIDLTGAAPTNGDVAVGPRRRILIVDDEPDVYGWLRIALEPLRWDVNAARNASDALEMAVRLLPDVVLLDQQLPDGSGIEIGRWLRRNQPSMELVMFSAYLDLRTEEQAAQLGIKTISKIDHRALFATLAAIRAEMDERTAAKRS